MSGLSGKTCCKPAMPSRLSPPSDHNIHFPFVRLNVYVVESENVIVIWFPELTKLYVSPDPDTESMQTVTKGLAEVAR